MIIITNRLKNLPISIVAETELALKLVIQASQEIIPLYDQGAKSSFESPNQSATKADILSS